MKETKEYIFKGITGTKTCPQCNEPIAKGYEYPWYGRDFCSEACGRAWFRRKGE